MGFFANTGTVWCLVELLLIPAWAAKMAAIAVSFVVNFSLSHFLVFRARHRAECRLTTGRRVHALRRQSDGRSCPSFVTHLECAMTGERHEADQVHNLSRAGKPLLVRYDLAGVRKALSKDKLAARPPDLWRYRELLPVRKPEDIVSLGEAMTPIVRMPRLADEARRRRNPGEGRRPPADRLVQGARPGHGGVDGEGARHQAHGDADQRQCRRGARRLRDARRHQDDDLLSGGHAGSERQRNRAAGRDRLSRQRPDRRLRQDRRRGQGQGRLVRHLDLEGAVPDRRQEDDGPRARRATRLAGAGRRSSIRPAAAPA